MPDVPTTMQNLLDALSDRRPGIVRLDGPGARRLASTWAAAHATHGVVDVESRPTGGERIWLDDAPGARSVADRWCFWGVVGDLDVQLVLTGRATDGGHPDVGTTLHVDGEGTPSIASCAVTIPADAWPEVVDEKPLTALAHLERFRDADDSEARRFSWLELFRLRLTGRHHDIPERTASLRTVRDNGRDFFEIARALQVCGERQTATAYFRAILHHADDPTVRLDAAYLLSRWARDAGADVPLAVPASPPERYAHAILSGREPDPTSPVARAVRGGMDALVRYGSLGLAAPSYTPGSRGQTLYGRSGRHLAAGLALREALDTGTDTDVLRRRLADIQPLERVAPTLHALMAGRVAARLGDVPATRRLSRAFAHAHLGHRSTVPSLLPRIDDRTPVWTTATWLQALWDDETVRAEVLAHAEQLPPLPLAIGDYRLERPLGRGGSGTVWRAVHVPTGRPVAAKVLHAETEEARHQFERELAIAASLDHPAIAAVWDWTTVHPVAAAQSRGRLDAGQLVVVTELVEGGSLELVCGELAWATCQQVLLGLLDALAYVHSHGLVHRDIKPANVLFDADAGLRLTDFGLTAADGRVAGTPAYMPPEQFHHASVGRTADLYALGCTAFALVGGLPPFLGDLRALEHAHRVAPRPPLDPCVAVPSGLEAWIHRCMAIAPADRFQTAAEAAEQLLALGAPVRAPSTPAGARRVVVADTCVLSIDDAPAPQVDVPSGRVHEVFAPWSAWRRGLPTLRRLEAGDPMPSFQLDAAEALWSQLLAVHRTGQGRRVTLVGPAGVGAGLLVRQLLRRARMAGLDVARPPVPGALGVGVDHPPGSVGEPWLLVDRAARARPDQLAVHLHRPTPLQCQWVVSSRLAIAPHVAAQAALEALGNPRRALEHIAQWSRSPGLHADDGLLTLAGPVPRRRCARRHADPARCGVGRAGRRPRTRRAGAARR